MYEKPPKDPKDKNEVIQVDFQEKKRIAKPQRREKPLPKLTINEEKEIDAYIFSELENGKLLLGEQVAKAREKFDEYKHFISHGQYSESHYQIFKNNSRTKKIGDRPHLIKNEMPDIFSEDEKLLYEKVMNLENEYNQHIKEFLGRKSAIEYRLELKYIYLENYQGTEEIKKRLKEYIKKLDFSFSSPNFKSEVAQVEKDEQRIRDLEEFIRRIMN